MKFKVGDKVVINDKCTAYKDLVGKHGTVADVIAGSCRVKIENDHYVWIIDEVLSLDNSMKFKIGDHVIVSGNVYHYGGCRGKVIDAYSAGSKAYVVELVKNGEYYSRVFLADELVLDNDVLRQIDVKMVKHFEHVRWEVGDKVNVIGGDCKGCVGRIVDHYTTAGIERTRETYAVEMIKDGRWTQIELDGSCIERAEPKKTKSDDIWHVNAAEFALRDCSGLAFGEDACDEAE